ncbi:MAG: hypothetical protein QOG64_1986 [Acidimicrobiaceae bacterium]|jgi:hypothetical protein|nr:hypothetical protein [Acidimicrobiaceae bacterium]
MDEGATPDVGELVAQLRARVEERRQAGVYPPGMEEDLDRHFQRIAAHRTLPDLSGVRAAMSALDAKASFAAHRIATASGVPGGGFVHRVLAKLQRRQTEGILEQVQQFADATRDALRAIVVAMEQPANHTHGELVGEIDAILDRMDAYERSRATDGPH